MSYLQKRDFFKVLKKSPYYDEYYRKTISLFGRTNTDKLSNAKVDNLFIIENNVEILENLIYYGINVNAK